MEKAILHYAAMAQNNLKFCQDEDLENMNLGIRENCKTYLWSSDNFNKRRNALYLLGWISDMLDEGFQCQAMYDFQNNFDVAQASCSFERIITELDLLKKFSVAEINEDFLFVISLYEYHNGYYDSACEFLYYKKYIVDKLNFPYTLNYSEVSDKYYAENMQGIELEEFSRFFLEEKSILPREDGK